VAYYEATLARLHGDLQWLRARQRITDAAKLEREAIAARQQLDDARRHAADAVTLARTPAELAAAIASRARVIELQAEKDRRRRAAEAAAAAATKARGL
jgi:hypothetical protein